MALAVAGSAVVANEIAPSEPLRALGPAPKGDDGRFENWTPGLPRAGPSVTLPFFARRMTSVFREAEGLPERVVPDLALIRRTNPIVTWVGHATLLVRMGGATFLTDPTWSMAAGPGGVLGARRFDDPGVPLEDLPPVDFVVVSHNHYDHLDLPSLERIAELHPRARFFVPLGNAELLEDEGIANVEELDWGETRQVGDVTVHCLPAQHWSQRGVLDQRKALWSSWAVTSDERRFYFGGDTGLFEGFGVIGEHLGPFDLAAVPIGAYEPQAMMFFAHMDPEQAVAAGVALRARTVLGMHFGTFDLSDEPQGEPPERFLAAAEAAGIAPEDAWILRLGESRPF